MLEEKKTGGGEIIHMEEFTARIARTPDRDFARPGLLRLVRLAHERGEDMRALEIEVVVRPIEVGRHGADEIRSVLTRVCLAKFDPGNLRHRIGFVRRLERSA